MTPFILLGIALAMDSKRKAIRMASTLHRFKPDHTRVLTAGVTGLPSEEFAWRHFSREILPQIRWNEVAPSGKAANCRAGPVMAGVTYRSILRCFRRHLRFDSDSSADSNER